jgi:hypothetical protein
VPLQSETIQLDFVGVIVYFFHNFLGLDCSVVLMLAQPGDKEDLMPKRKGKAVSFDAMVKFFMQHYSIPTKKDVEKLIARLDRLENLIKNAASGAELSGPGFMRRRITQTAVDVVLEAIKGSKQGLGFREIQAQTGFGEKKIRNIIFRLNKTGRIKRMNRGVYTAI